MDKANCGWIATVAGRLRFESSSQLLRVRLLSTMETIKIGPNSHDVSSETLDKITELIREDEEQRLWEKHQKWASREGDTHEEIFVAGLRTARKAYEPTGDYYAIAYGRAESGSTSREAVSALHDALMADEAVKVGQCYATKVGRLVE